MRGQNSRSRIFKSAKGVGLLYKLKVGISKEASASSIEMGDKLEFMGADAARFVDAMVGACGAFLINSVFLKLGSNQLTEQG